jgi:hypothetical protein
MEIVLAHLAELIADRAVVPVVGEGVLTLREGSGYRRVTDILAERLAAEFDAPWQAGTSVREVAAQLLKGDKHDPQFLRSRLNRLHRKLVDGCTPDDYGPALRAISKISDWPLIVTTCPSGLLEHALEQLRGIRPYRVVLGAGESQDIPAQTVEGQLLVIHAFGRVSRSLSFPLTDEDILENLRDFQGDHRPERLLDVIANKSLLFLGTSMPDWLTRMFIRALRRGRLSNDQYLKALADEPQDDRLVGFLENLRQTRIYQGQPAEFAEQLLEAWQEESEDPDRINRLPELEETSLHEADIFLSYSSADRPAAERAVQAFREHDLSVWFDGEQLRAGDGFEARIRQGVRKCEFFVPLISKNTERDRESYFRTEWRMALDRTKSQTGAERRFIVPLIIDDELAPGALGAVPADFLDLTIEQAPRGMPSTELLRQLVDDIRSLRMKQAAGQ